MIGLTLDAPLRGGALQDAQDEGGMTDRKAVVFKKLDVPTLMCCTSFIGTAWKRRSSRTKWRRR